MKPDEHEKVTVGHYERVLGEETVDEILAKDLDDLRQRILRIIEARPSEPIIVTTLDNNNDDPTIKHAFLIERGYRQTDSEAILETIISRPKNIKSYQEKKELEMKAWESKRATKAEQAAFIKKAIPDMVERSLQVLGEQYEHTLKELGFANNEEFKEYWLNLHSRRNDFATQEQYMDFVRTEWDKRVEEARDRARQREYFISPKPEMASQLPSILNDEMTIVCRIIGKDSELTKFRSGSLLWDSEYRSVVRYGI